MSVFVHWHVTSHGTCSMAHRNCGYKKWFYNNIANYIWLLNCPLCFFFCQKKYIENNTTYNQIHFQVIIFWLHRGEDKCSILFRDTNSDRPSPKVPHLSHILRQRYLKMDQSRPVEAGACHKVLIITTLSQKTDSTYRQNNHYQHHHWYTKISCAHEIFFFFSSVFNSLPQFYKTPLKHFTKFLWHATPTRAFFAKKGGTWLQL